jgi:hypothetical protein
MRLICLVLFFWVLSISQGHAWTADNLGWSAWDSKHSVARKENWMVIKEPGRKACYLKQGYTKEKMMDLTVNENNTPCLWAPFSSEPVDVQVVYRVGDITKGRIQAKEVTNGIRLPQELVHFMRRGFVMQVEVESVDPDVELGSVKEQEFSLLGFIAATEVLNSDACQE